MVNESTVKYYQFISKLRKIARLDEFIILYLMSFWIFCSELVIDALLDQVLEYWILKLAHFESMEKKFQCDKYDLYIYCNIVVDNIAIVLIFVLYIYIIKK